MALTIDVECRRLNERVVEPLELEENTLTVRELIESRVRGQLHARSDVDVPRAVREALDAFRQSTYLVVLDDRRLESLDERVTLTPVSRLTFWRLVPLVGG